MPYYPPNRQEPEPQPKQAPRRNSARRIVLLVSVLMILGGGIPLGKYIADYVSSRRTAEELKSIAEETAGTETEGTVPSAPPALTPALPAEAPGKAEAEKNGTKETVSDVSPAGSDTLPRVTYPGGGVFVDRIHRLQQKSRYVFGWLKMEGVDEPVAWKDNIFFLDHDATGKRNANGAIFMDEKTDLSSRPYTILLYGHNMKTGTMFGGLRKFEDFAYCYKHREIQFDTLYEEGKYEIFAVSTINLTPGRSRYVSLSDLRSDNRSDRKEAIRALMTCSTLGIRNDVSEEDQILLLITCTGDDDERLIVAARRTE